MIAADASIPDNPSGPNQTQSAEKANLSSPACDGVVLVRTAPTASIAASATAVKVGDLVSFQSQASDATSGLGARSDWTWGDNTAGGSGGATTHTFTQAGTYPDYGPRRGARIASHRAPKLEGGPVALPDGRFHGRRSAHSFKVG